MKVYILGGKRTAIGNYLGSLKDISPGVLGGEVIKDLLKIFDKGLIDEVIVGNVLSAGQSQGVGRQASIYGGIDESVVAYTINMICGSGMKSVMLAASEIKAKQKDIVIAGGVEVMSQAPFLVPAKVRGGAGLGNLQMEDSLVKDALTDAYSGIHMGITAENIAEKYQITRQEQDEYAAASQKKAQIARESNKFKDEVSPIVIKARKGDFVFEDDEFIKPNTNLDTLSKLRPAFKKDGTVTAANSSGINDGASFTLLASEEAVNKNNLQPLFEIIDYAQVGIDPKFMGLSPAFAIEKLLTKNNLSFNDVDLYELNEAFAAQTIGVLKILTEKYNLTTADIANRVNLNGGAIALGHPVGASGNRIIVTLMHQMLQRNLDLGIASLCIGGGLGTAVLIKMI